jgi:hypothetical protein
MSDMMHHHLFLLLHGLSYFLTVWIWVTKYVWFYLSFNCELGYFNQISRKACWKLESWQAVTNSVEYCSSWEASIHLGSWEIPHFSQNPKVHYHHHNSPPLILILSHMNPVLMSYLFKIHFNIILPSTPRSQKWCLPFMFCVHICWREEMKERIRRAGRNVLASWKPPPTRSHGITTKKTMINKYIEILLWVFMQYIIHSVFLYIRKNGKRTTMFVFVK